MNKLSFFAIFATVLVNSQQFRPAEITMSTGQKLTGNVSYNTPIYTPQMFEVKNDSGGITKIGLNDATLVTINNKTRFVRANIQLSRHPENLQRLEYNPAFSMKNETRFIEQLVVGKYNLYKYSDDQNKAFFYSTTDEPNIKPLLYKEYLISSGENEGAKTSNKQYLQDLRQISCGDVDYNSVRYLESSLETYFMKINQCNGDSVQSFQKEQGYIDHKVYGLYSTYSDGFNTSYGGGYEFEYHLPFLNYSFAVAAAPNFTTFTNTDTRANFTKTTEMALPILARYYPIKTKDFKGYFSYSVVNFIRDNVEYTGNASDLNSNSFGIKNFFEVGLRYKWVETFTRIYTAKGSPFVLGVKFNFISGEKK